MKFLRPLPRRVTRPLSILVMLAWAGTTVVLVNRSFLQASSANLATDLARYGSAAQWRGVYYRNEKIGFTVSQTVATDDGFELQEDGRLQMSLLGAQTAAVIRTRARVDRAFTLQSFDFSLDPGTGGTTVRGQVDGTRLRLSVTSASGTRSEDREIAEPPVLAITLARRLAGAGLESGARYQWTIFDPATLTSAPVALEIGKREVVQLDGRSQFGIPMSVPAFRAELQYAGLRTTSWITDTGEVVREQSPMGLETVRESPERARAMAVPYKVREDLLEASAVVPESKLRIDEPRDVRRLRLRLTGADLSSPDLRGVGQSVDGDIVEIRDPQGLRPEAADPDVGRYLTPEPFLESDAPEIRAEAAAAVKGVSGVRARAERLTRHVNAILEKKPTISLPSALEVLRTRVGDCNEHTALYVAMARALEIPARIAVGLVSVRGAFYYHAWPEVYLTEGKGRGLWLPVDPTLNQFPADGTHLRLARGGLDKQAAILPLVGRLKITILDLEIAPNTTPVVVGRQPDDMAPLSIALPKRAAAGDCWSAAPRTGRRR
jgi:transglutaminase-like putative cysteine protease